ncbi:MAG: hypothetical protein KJO76_05330 [Gammaproteobacteria bacterium]|nr:hypothetical protein [Gammaproteobacteria bacterium]
MKEIGDLLRETALLPADLLVPVLMPGFEIIGYSNEFLLSISVSMVFWLLLLAAAWKLAKFVQSAIRGIGIAVRSRWFLTKTRVARRRGLLIPYKHAGKRDPETEVEFNELDLAVLNSAAALAQGFELSAPDLAKNLKSQRTKVQSSLEKLATNMMLERALGTTDDHENYRLAPAGAAFLSMMQRNEG